MKKRAWRGALALLAVLMLTLSAAAAEGYMMVFGSLTVYADRELTVPLGEIRDASIVYVPASGEAEDDPVYAVVFGDRWVLRTGYAAGGALMPLMPQEAERYAEEAREGMRYSENVFLLNAYFVAAKETDEPDETGAAEETVTSEEADAAEETVTAKETDAPEETPGPTAVPTPPVTPSPLPTVTPTPVPVTLPPTPTKNPASRVNVVVPPTDVAGFSGEEVVLAVGVTGAAAYQWQYFDGTTWVDSVMEQATAPAMKLVVFEGGRERIYRCVIRGTDGTTVYTEPVRIIVQK